MSLGCLHFKIQLAKVAEIQSIRTHCISVESKVNKPHSSQALLSPRFGGAGSSPTRNKNVTSSFLPIGTRTISQQHTGHVVSYILRQSSEICLRRLSHNSKNTNHMKISVCKTDRVNCHRLLTLFKVIFEISSPNPDFYAASSPCFQRPSTPDEADKTITNLL